jgi:hypothetical protein
MTRKIAGTCFAAVLGFALSAAAQTPPADPQTPPPSTPQAAPTSPYPSSQSADKMDKADKGKSSKLTGCVQSGTTAGTFELSNIKKGGKSDSMSASASDSSSKTVKLVAAAGVDLTQHVGHQVEVTGSWNKDSASASPSASPDASASASGSKGTEFNVTDVKMVSATCSAGTQ